MKIHDPAPHDVWHFVIGGFLQDRDEVNGVLRLWDRLSKRAGPHVHVRLLEWHDDMEEVAQQVAIVKLLHDAPCRVTIDGFSFGGGWGAPRLARALDRRDIRVSRMNLCDPVYKHPLWLLWLLSLSPWRKIRIPANVDHVDYFLQRNGRPMGHELVAEGERTTIAPPIFVKGVTHVHMHKLDAWHQRAVANARLVA